MHLPGTQRFRIIVILVWLFIVWLIFKSWSRNGPELNTNVRATSRQTSVPVTVFYEALCPDSKNFIIRQLAPAYLKKPDLIDLTLVPYGKATTSTSPDGTVSFECQHGPIECQANIFHACTIVHIVDPVLRLFVVQCMIANNIIPRDAFNQCAEKYEVTTWPILQCSDGAEGVALLKQHGEATHALHPKITFIPTVVLNGSRDRQESILRDFSLELCKVITDGDPNSSSCTM